MPEAVTLGYPMWLAYLVWLVYDVASVASMLLFSKNVPCTKIEVPGTSGTYRPELRILVPRYPQELNPSNQKIFQPPTALPLLKITE